MEESAAPLDRARLVVLSGTGTGRSCVVATEVVIGRGVDVGFTLANGEISRQHARVFRTGRREFAIVDMGSRNGTTVNGTAVTAEPRALTFGDKIDVGGAAVLLFAHFDPAEERMMQAQKLQSLGQLASGVAHDINNLLGSVLGNMEYLKEALQKDPELSRAVGDSEEALLRVVDMVRRLVEFSRRGKFESRPVPLFPLLQQASHVMDHKSRSKVTVELEVPPQLVVLGDSTQLLQVMTNLVGNAMDAMPHGGIIHITAAAVDVGETGVPEAPHLPPGRFARVAVRDHGTGMTPEVMERLFEPFFTTKPTGKGTGLGLATVHGIVNNHGGHVGVTSTLGKGSTFVVHLPLAADMDVGETSPAVRWTPPADAPVPAVHAAHASVSGTGPVILLVDDEPLMQRSTQRILTRMGGLEVALACDGEEAVALYRSLKDRVMVVLMDVNMPRKNGVEACLEIRQLNPQARVVLTSGTVQEEQLGSLPGTPGVTFLLKPYDEKTLRAAMEKVLAPL